MTQREKVIAELRRKRRSGVHSFWGYANYIPRIGARIYDLKREGFEIISLHNKKDSGCTYFLKTVPESMKTVKDRIAEKLNFKIKNNN